MHRKDENKDTCTSTMRSQQNVGEVPTGVLESACRAVLCQV